ncbi:zinc protease [Bacteroidia bacterium]|nr:zinc protease [Bacteroidia bacterium]
MDKQFHDDELGTVTLRIHPRAKYYSLKVVNGVVIATMPPGGDPKRLLAFIKERKQALLDALKKAPAVKPLLSDATVMQTNTFKVEITCTERDNFYMQLDAKLGVLHISCPKATNFEDKRVQQILHSFLERALRHEAKRILPSRIHALSEQYNFSFNRLRIANTKSRWGSCSTNCNISLSLSLMLLPDHLVNYVILHELCHTVEMNHSDRFWSLMNSVTNNQALTLRHELRNYHTKAF